MSVCVCGRTQAEELCLVVCSFGAGLLASTLNECCSRAGSEAHAAAAGEARAAAERRVEQLHAEKHRL
eukprot:4828632-Pleurochrysis_carterae.AAC.1